MSLSTSKPNPEDKPKLNPSASMAFKPEPKPALSFFEQAAKSNKDKPAKAPKAPSARANRFDLDSIETKKVKFSLDEVKSYKVSKWDKYADELLEPGDAIGFPRESISMSALQSGARRLRKVFKKNIIAMSHRDDETHYYLAMKDGPIEETSNDSDPGEEEEDD